MSIKAKFEARAKVVHEARALQDRCDAEKRDMSAEEKASFDEMMKAVDALKGEIDALKAGEVGEEDERDEEGEDDKKKKLEDAERDVEEDKRFAGRRTGGMNPEHRTQSNDARYAKAYRHWLRTGVEQRDLSLGTNSTGGYLLTPTQMSKDLIVALNNLVFVRGLCDIETLNEAKSLGVPQITADVADADWTSEVPSSLAAESSLTLARRDLSPNLLCKLVLASHRLLQSSSAPEAVIMQRLAYKFAVSEEKAFLTGSGSGQPLGLYTASASGISTGRDKTAASATVFTADELIDTLYKIPQQYQKSPSFGWILHRDTVAKVRKLKDGNGSYIWQMGVSADRPDTLLGFNVYQSEYAPNTYTTGLYVALVGDMKFYKIADVANMEIQRLVERYADTNQIGFLGRRYIDASPVLENAFARLKLA